MAVEFIQKSFDSSTGILAFPDHYVAVGRTLPKNSALAVTVGTRKIVKAGTIYPANDNTAIGIVFSDYDVTDGDQQAAIILHGFIKTAALPEAPSADVPASQLTEAPYTFTPAVEGAKTTLAKRGIVFLPVE